MPENIKTTIQQLKSAIALLIKERGVRAEFQSSIALFLVACWFFFVPDVIPSGYISILSRILPLCFWAALMVIVAISQTVGNIFYHPKLRIASAFASWFTWTTLALFGYFSSFNALVVPLSTSFAIVQALVFIHLEREGV